MLSYAKMVICPPRRRLSDGCMKYDTEFHSDDWLRSVYFTLRGITSPTRSRVILIYEFSTSDLKTIV